MKKSWLHSLIVILFVLALIGVVLYYASVSITPTPVTANVTATQVLKDDFLFQVSVDKPEYKYDEQVVVYFNLTYVGKSSKVVNLNKENSPFLLIVSNATHNRIGDSIILSSGADYNFTYGMSVLGKAVIDGQSYRYAPAGGGGKFLGFDPGSRYDIQGFVGIGSITLNGLSIELTSPMLPIRIARMTKT